MFDWTISGMSLMSAFCHCQRCRPHISISYRQYDIGLIHWCGISEQLQGYATIHSCFYWGRDVTKVTWGWVVLSLFFSLNIVSLSIPDAIWSTTIGWCSHTATHVQASPWPGTFSQHRKSFNWAWRIRASHRQICQTIFALWKTNIWLVVWNIFYFPMYWE